MNSPLYVATLCLVPLLTETTQCKSERHSSSLIVHNSEIQCDYCLDQTREGVNFRPLKLSSLPYLQTNLKTPKIRPKKNPQLAGKYGSNTSEAKC
jgi:hypothetical protein